MINWGEFKKAIEEAGVVDTTEIEYIDLHGTHLPDVTVLADGSFWVQDGLRKIPWDTEPDDVEPGTEFGR